MKRAVLAILGTAAGTTLLVSLKAGPGIGPAAGSGPLGAAERVPAATAASRPPATIARPTTSAVATAPPRPGGTAAAPAAPPAAGLAGGRFTGATVRTKYGPVQVAIVVSGGRMTDVIALRLPDEELRSVRINERAVPILRQDALAAQSARIDTVSGATYTSEGYRTSLQAALDVAKRG